MSKPRPRLTVDEYLNLITVYVACRGTCDRLRTATVITDKRNKIIATGYNGSPPGAEHCDDVGHLMVEGHCVRTNHGEDNAILNCLDLTKVEGGTVTVVGNPCYPCARKLVALKPARVRYIGDYKNALGGGLVEDLCQKHSVKIERIAVKDVIDQLRKAIAFLQGPGGPFKDLPPMRF